MTSQRYSWLQRRDRVVRYCNRRYLSRVMPTMSSGDGMRRCGGSCSSTAR